MSYGGLLAVFPLLAVLFAQASAGAASTQPARLVIDDTRRATLTLPSDASVDWTPSDGGWPYAMDVFGSGRAVGVVITGTEENESLVLAAVRVADAESEQTVIVATQASRGRLAGNTGDTEACNVCTLAAGEYDVVVIAEEPQTEVAISIDFGGADMILDGPESIALLAYPPLSGSRTPTLISGGEVASYLYLVAGERREGILVRSHILNVGARQDPVAVTRFVPCLLEPARQCEQRIGVGGTYSGIAQAVDRVSFGPEDPLGIATGYDILGDATYVVSHLAVWVPNV